jgi:heat-inducible transcriptional repressor
VNLMNQDAPSQPKLTERQLRILSALILAYTNQPEPVSSKQLSEDNALNVSSATIRNELAVLEQLGMLRSPHTSAGRVPTEQGYRYFVQHLLTAQELSIPEQQKIRAEFDLAARDMQKWVRMAAGILARRTNATALVTEPRSRAATFKNLQLISLHEKLALLVIVLDGGDLTQQMLTLEEDTDQERLSQVAAMLNALCRGETSAGIRQKAVSVNDLLARDTMELLADVMQESEASTRFALHWHGVGDILTRFEGGESAQQALRILDGNTLLNNVLAEAIENDQENVRVLVGGDGRYEELSELSIVVGSYGTRQLVGAISVLGPTRMRYGRVISTVRYVSTLMSAMMQDIYGTNH